MIWRWLKREREELAEKELEDCLDEKNALEARQTELRRRVLELETQVVGHAPPPPSKTV